MLSVQSPGLELFIRLSIWYRQDFSSSSIRCLLRALASSLVKSGTGLIGLVGAILLCLNLRQRKEQSRARNPVGSSASWKFLIIMTAFVVRGKFLDLLSYGG